MTSGSITIPIDQKPITYRFVAPPKPVGYWCLYGGAHHTQFAMYEKPSDEQIENTTRVLGWVWKDEK